VAAVAAACVVVVAAAATAVVDADRSENTMAKINSIDSKNSPRRLAWLLAAGLVVGATLLPAASKDGQRTFATPQEAVQATIDAAEPSASFSDLRARTLSNPAMPPKTRTLAPSLRARLTKSSRLMRTG
jgi:hypothetical protein